MEEWYVEVLDNPLTEESEVVSLTRRPPFTLQEDSCLSFLLEAESIPRAIMRLEGLDKLKNPMTESTTFRLVA
jgi:hypothetical protein